MSNNYKKATFAGGCFWCMVKPFKQWDGIIDVVSGYMGGHVENPTYDIVKAGNSGHLEVVEITYDPTLFTYEELLKIYWQQIDPTDEGGQFQDRGYAYSTAIFYYDEQQKVLALKTKAQLNSSDLYEERIVTPIRPAQTFYAAEEYHQDYYEKEPEHYEEDRKKSGRDEFLTRIWNES